MKRTIYILFVGMMILTACALPRDDQPNLTNSREPAIAPTPIPPTPAPQLIDLKSGGFLLAVRPDLEFDLDDHSINLSDRQGELLISLNGKPYIGSSYTLESFLGKYVAEMAARGGIFDQSDPYEITIDGMTGIAVDLTGSFQDAPIAGKVIVISPGKDFIIFGLGMSDLTAHENGWAETGSPIFEFLIESIRFKAEIKG